MSQVKKREGEVANELDWIKAVSQALNQFVATLRVAKTEVRVHVPHEGTVTPQEMTQLKAAVRVLDSIINSGAKASLEDARIVPQEGSQDKDVAIKNASSFEELIQVVESVLVDDIRRDDFVTSLRQLELMATLGIPYNLSDGRTVNFRSLIGKHGLRQKGEELYQQVFEQRTHKGLVGNNLRDAIRDGEFRSPQELLTFLDFLVKSQDIDKISFNTERGERKTYSLTQDLIPQLRALINGGLMERQQLSRVIRPIFDFK